MYLHGRRKSCGSKDQSGWRGCTHAQDGLQNIGANSTLAAACCCHLEKEFRPQDSRFAGSKKSEVQVQPSSQTTESVLSSRFEYVCLWLCGLPHRRKGVMECSRWSIRQIPVLPRHQSRIQEHPPRNEFRPFVFSYSVCEPTSLSLISFRL